MLKKLLNVTCLLLISTLIFSSCTKENNKKEKQLIGKWKTTKTIDIEINLEDGTSETFEDLSTDKNYSIIEFKSDNKYTIEYYDEEEGMEQEHGTYNATEDILTMTMTGPISLSIDFSYTINKNNLVLKYTYTSEDGTFKSDSEMFLTKLK